MLNTLRLEDVSKVRSALKSNTKKDQFSNFAVQVFDLNYGPSKLGVVEYLDNKYVLRTYHASISELVRVLLKRDLGLTDAEVQVLSKLLLGQSLKSIAQTKIRSIDTIRNQVKAISQKIGAGSQKDIVRSAMELSRLVDTYTNDASTNSNTERRSKSVNTKDGRQISYDIYGHPSGYPLLYFHCMISGRHWPQNAQEKLKERNFKVISMSRAGYGDSEANSINDDRLSLPN